MTTRKLPENLIVAMYRKDYKTLERLLNADNINFVDDGGATLLNLAVASGDADSEMVQFLVDHGALVDVPSGTEKWTALHFAAYTLRRDLVQVLLNAGADANAEDSSGDTPLSKAVMAPDPKVFLVHLLLQYGADPDRKSKGGASPKDLALSTEQLNLFGTVDKPKRKRNASVKTIQRMKKQ